MKRELKERLKNLGIAIVYLFGSRAVGMQSPLSDVDIGVVLRDPQFDGDTRDLYHALYKLFSKLFPTSKLDIVFLQMASLSLQNAAIKDGKILYEENPKARVYYEQLVLNQYLDFRPVLDYFDQITMQRYVKTSSSTKPGSFTN